MKWKAVIVPGEKVSYLMALNVMRLYLNKIRYDMGSQYSFLKTGSYRA